MADNTLQFDWISIIKWNLEHVFAKREDVFVAGDNLIYPIEGDPTDRKAPDVYVAFGRPKGYRGSYKLWEESGIFPQVIFEVLSPKNTAMEMTRKRLWYERYGTDEFYVIDPYEPPTAQGWRRVQGKLIPVETNGFVSPLLGVRFEFTDEKLTLVGPDGRPFLTPSEMAAAEKQRADALAAKLRALGIDPDA